MTATSSQPSSPQLSRICLVACTSNGTVAYSHFCCMAVTLAVRAGRRSACPRSLAGPGRTAGRKREQRVGGRCPATGRLSGRTPQRPDVSATDASAAGRLVTGRLGLVASAVLGRVGAGSAGGSRVGNPGLRYRGLGDLGLGDQRI